MNKCCLLGTAPSWCDAPWDDLSIEIFSLNDAYLCRDKAGKGLRRVNRWYELHPFDKMWLRPADKPVVYAHEIPKGHYVRPEGHLEWLKTQAMTIPVVLQQNPPDDWPSNAFRLPLEAIEAKFGMFWGDQPYWASGPSFMLAHAILEGYQEIHVYGIHLSTQAEYIEQRPNFEHLLGIAKGLGIKVVMAPKSPLLKHGWKYAYEPKPVPEVPETLASARKDIQRVRTQKAETVRALVQWPWWKPKGSTMAQLQELELLEADLAQQIARHHAQASVTTVGG
jgi:hypothetical protein